MIVWTCTRQSTIYKEVAGEEEEEEKNCLPNRDLSINATIIYLYRSVAKVNFVCLLFSDLYATGEKNDVFYIFRDAILYIEFMLYGLRLHVWIEI